MTNRTFNMLTVILGVLAIAIFTINTISLYIKLTRYNAYGVLDRASICLIVAGIAMTLMISRQTTLSKAATNDFCRIKRVIALVLKCLIAGVLICAVIVVAASRFDGIPDSSAPLLQHLPKYELQAHGRVSQVTRMRYLLTGTGIWLAKLLFETGMALVFTLSALDRAGRK